MFIGYARVSTADQKLDLQNDALTKTGCERIFTDTAGGASAEREGLEQALAFARKGDTIVVWKLDRLGRSLPHLIDMVSGLRQRGVGFRSLTETIDTTNAMGDSLAAKLGGTYLYALENRDELPLGVWLRRITDFAGTGELDVKGSISWSTFDALRPIQMVSFGATEASPK